MQLSGEGSRLVMADVIIKKKNEVFLQISCELHIEHELQDEFTFDVPGAKFMPQYRNKYWDGKIRLYNLQKKEIYVGLLDKVTSFCRRYDYDFEFENSKYYGLPYQETEGVSHEGVKEYLTGISKYKPRLTSNPVKRAGDLRYFFSIFSKGFLHFLSFSSFDTKPTAPGWHLYCSPSQAPHSYITSPFSIVHGSEQ